jgi:hypothetical protein
MKTQRILGALLFTVFASAHAQDIAGTYYSSKDMNGTGSTNQYKIAYKPEELTIMITYADGQASVKGMPHPNLQEAVKKGEFFQFKMAAFGPRHINTVELIQIEPGIFVVDPATRVDVGCTETTRSTAPAGGKGGKVYENESIQREYIIGKDENRVKALVANKAEYEKLIADAVMKRCQVVSGNFGAKNPPPAEGMTDASLKSDALTLIKAWATQRRWPESVMSAYIKSTEWSTLRNRNTGAITGRELVAVVYHKKNTACAWREFVVRQDYNGSSYGKGYIQGESQASYPIDCAKIK